MKKIKHLRINIFLLAVLVFALAACAPKNESSATLTFDANASGPFFSGPNSLIAEYDVDLSTIEGLEGVSKEQIKEINIKAVSVKLNMDEEVNFDAFSSASLQMVGADTDMQTIAIKNPIDSKNSEIALQVSEEADIVDYFKGQKFSVVLDLDFVEDSFSEEAGATITKEINVKHN